MSEDRKPFESWAVVELMGHNVTAGFVTEAVIAGAVLLRVDVPAIGGGDADGLPIGRPARAGFTRYFGGGAVYSITPCDEATARAVVEHYRPRPMTLFVPALESPRDALPDGDHA